MIKRECKRVLLSFMHQIDAKKDRIRVKRYLPYFDATVVENEIPKQVNSIVFVITRMVRFHGGQTSILRLGTELSKLGYAVTYAVYKPQSKEEMELCAKSNLSYVEGSFATAEEVTELKADVVVASSWDTVSVVKKMKGYHMYFVQDYEPYFYPFGELFLMAQKTYEQGLHMVSLGDWNKEMILRECHVCSDVDRIDFPYERRDYQEHPRDYLAYGKKKELTVAVYVKFYGKRLPTLIPYIMVEAKKQFASQGIKLNVLYFGEAKSFKCPGGKNLGMLTKQQLAELYQKADFGLVASLSNISLVPYEMLATGLPVIEFEDGTFSYFFKEDCATLISLSGQDLYEKVMADLKNPQHLQKQIENAKKYFETLSWQKSAKQFDEIVKQVVASCPKK